MNKVIIDRELLDIYDKYDQDFGLLHERWASAPDRQKVSDEQATLLSEYVEKLHSSKFDIYSAQMKEDALERIRQIERVMDPGVVEILRNRVLES